MAIIEHYNNVGKRLKKLRQEYKKIKDKMNKTAEEEKVHGRAWRTTKAPSIVTSVNAVLYIFMYKLLWYCIVQCLSDLIWKMIKY